MDAASAQRSIESVRCAKQVILLVLVVHERAHNGKILSSPTTAQADLNTRTQIMCLLSIDP